MDTNNAYKCFCTPERLEELRGKATKLKRPFKYDQKCRQLKDQEINQLLAQKIPFTIRLKIHMENSNSVIVSDLVRGESKFNTKNLQDIILMKSDEYPTYHFANVIDDHLMGITHVLRGEEWSSSTPIHLLIYKAFCWTPPLYAHLPLLVHPNGSKLSKRSDGDLGNVQSYIDDGYLPEALVNFIAFLGWSPKSFDNLDDSKKRNESEIFQDIYSLSKAVFFNNIVFNSRYKFFAFMCRYKKTSFDQQGTFTKHSQFRHQKETRSNRKSARNIKKGNKTFNRCIKK